MKTKYIWILLLLGLILRLIIIFWSFNFPQNPDLLRHRDWGRIAFLHGISKTYDSKYITYGEKPNNLPPGSTYIISGAYLASLQFSKLLIKIFQIPEGANNILNIYVVDLFLKLPTILSDLIISYFIYLIVKSKKDINNAHFACALFLFNPVVIYNSAIWGQIDALNNTAFIISLYFLIKKEIFLSVFFYLFSLYFKLSLLPLLPLYLLFLYHYKISSWKLFKYSLFSALIFFVLTIFFFPDVSQWMDLFIFNNFKQEANFITVNAFNFWYFIFLPFFPKGIFPSTNQLYLVSYFIFTILCLPLFIIVFKNKNKIKPELLFLSFSLLSLLIFLFLPRMHERYLYPFFPLFTTYLGLNKKNLKYLIFISFTHFINLLIVWHPMAGSFMITLLQSNLLSWILSGSLLWVGLLFYYQTAKSFTNKNY